MPQVTFKIGRIFCLFALCCFGHAAKASPKPGSPFMHSSLVALSLLDFADPAMPVAERQAGPFRRASGDVRAE